MINLKTTLCALLATSSGYIANAQKTPSVQTASVLAPANIKIDGRATEWDNKFQAYNNHVEFFYTLSNDGNNLYLTVQAVDKAIVRRIINGGITLAVSKTGKKNDKDLAGITFPLFDKDNRFMPRFTGSSAAAAAVSPIMDALPPMPSGGGGDRVIRVVNANGSSLSNTPLTPAQTDSVMKVNNTNFSAKAKNIGTKGITGLDSLISVYNEDGVKAAGTFDNKTIFTCELAVPLKYFGLNTGNDKFMYHVTINQVEQKGVDIQTSTGPDGTQKTMSVHVGPGAQMGQDATDFWGEYTLAKSN